MADIWGDGEKGEKLRTAFTRAVLFFASEAAAFTFITRQTLGVSGGLTMAG